MKTQSKITLSTPLAQTIYTDLRAEGYKLRIGKKEYAEIVGCSVSAVSRGITKNYGIPPYTKIGNQANARVLFSLRDVAEYLAAQTIVIA